MSSYENYMDYILDKLDERTLLEQLAEEAVAEAEKMLAVVKEENNG